MNGKDDTQQQDTAIARLYRAGNNDEPAAHLDETILAASRREAGAGPRPVSPFGGQRLMTLSTAAVILIAFGLVTFMTEREPVMQQEPVALKEDKQAAPAAAKQKQLADKIINGKAEELAQRLQRQIQPQVRAPAPVAEQEMAGERLDNAGATSPDTAKPATTVPSGPQAGRLESRADATAERSREATGAALVGKGAADALQDTHPATPQDWLKTIDKLIAEDKLDAARSELKALQEKFPDFTLEKRYKDLLANN